MVRAHRPRIAGPTPRPQLAGSLDTQPQLKARMSRPMSTTAMTKALDQITFSFEFNRRISDDHPSCWTQLRDGKRVKAMVLCPSRRSICNSRASRT